MLRRVAGGLAAAVALVAIAGCAGSMNPRLTSYGDGGYRYANVRGDGQEEELFVILAFSGGGTRAAAFSYGLLEALQAVTYPRAAGPARSLLEDVDVISSVSGGSFTAAHYALFGTAGFKQLEEDFLYRNIQGKLILKALAPWNWFRLMRSDYSRIDMAAELYDEDIFHGATFATLLEHARGRPYVLLNATDMTAGARFEFTQDQFDLLCSDLSRVPVARGVAASSAFPILLSPMTLHNYPGDPADPRNPCDKFRPPTWLAQALKSADQPRRRALARNRISYRADVKTRPYIHLLDGGLADNIGLRAELESFKACEELAKEQCPAFQMPFEPAAEVEFYAVELAFDKVTDDLPLQPCLEGLATSFSLPRPQVTLLRQVARRLLLTSPEFLAAMRTITPSWKPEPAPIDPALVRDACPPS